MTTNCGALFQEELQDVGHRSSTMQFSRIQEDAFGYRYGPLVLSEPVDPPYVFESREQFTDSSGIARASRHQR